jgi:hypothetical protein
MQAHGGMAERICRDDKEPVASFGEFVYDYGDLGIYNTVFWGDFRNTGTQNLNATISFDWHFLN